MSNLANDMSNNLTDFSSASYLTLLDGEFSGVLRWEQLEELWATVNASDRAWYVNAPGHELSDEPLSAEALAHFLAELTTLLRKDHDEDYCGIVYVDDVSEPSMIKVYDPNNLGSVCGSSGKRTLPGWVLSTLKPVEMTLEVAPPANRQRWWQGLFAVNRVAA